MRIRIRPTLERLAIREGLTMSNDLQWNRQEAYEPEWERVRSLTEPLSPVVANPNENHLQDFAAVIENVIVPRLLMTHVNGGAPARVEAAAARSLAVSDFIRLTMDQEPDAAVHFVQQLLDEGVSFQRILLDLMAPAARELGECWLNDTMSFVEVTLGVARMHRILREFDGVPEFMWSKSGFGCHALLLPAPGEQHTFGLRLVQEFLLRESWSVTNKPVESPEALKAILRNGHYDVAGLSLSGETMIEPFQASIASIRAHSKNRDIKIIVGGHLFLERPELIKSCGADAYGADAPATVRIVNGWVNQLKVVT
jgi:MerR family transcriptional regulator, light-induced transcriptional regulator